MISKKTMEEERLRKKNSGKKLIVLFCAVSMLMAAGCGEKEKEHGLLSEPIGSQEQSTDNQPEEPGSDAQDNSAKEEAGEGNQDTGRAEEELEGYIKSIGESGVVIAKSFTEETDDGLIMVSGADGSGNEVLVTVSISGNAKYELHTVKNSGVNGDADVTKTDASFPDIREDVLVKLSGQYTSDSEFLADSVIIYNFI